MRRPRRHDLRSHDDVQIARRLPSAHLRLLDHEPETGCTNFENRIIYSSIACFWPTSCSCRMRSRMRDHVGSRWRINDQGPAIELAPRAGFGAKKPRKQNHLTALLGIAKSAEECRHMPHRLFALPLPNDCDQVREKACVHDSDADRVRPCDQVVKARLDVPRPPHE